MDRENNQNRLKGHNMERIACSWLEQQGMTLMASNFTSRFGEIDLVMMEPDNTLVFVEVKYRQHGQYGEGLEQVTFSKQRKIIRTAQYYLSRAGGREPCCRFDVLSVSGDEDSPGFDWIKNAFQAF